MGKQVNNLNLPAHSFCVCMWFLCMAQACVCRCAHLCTCTRRPEGVRCLSLSPPTLSEPAAHEFWLIWLATEGSGSAYCCPHCRGSQARGTCAQHFIHVLSFKLSSPQACRASSLVHRGIQTGRTQSHLYLVWVAVVMASRLPRRHPSKRDEVDRFRLFSMVLRF